MPDQNVATVHRIYDRWKRGDFSEVDAFDPDVDFELVDWPEPARTRGVDEMRRAWLATLNVWADFHAVPYKLIEQGNVIVVFNRIYARGKTSGMEADADSACVFTMEDGRVARLALYWDKSRALDAAGLAAAEPHAVPF